MPSSNDKYKQTLGPYLDSDVLNLSHPDPFPLDGLTLRHAQEIVGLDKIKEMLQNDDPSHDGAQFRGSITIQTMDWLSEKGRRWLQNDLTRMRLKLDKVIAKSTLVVLIQGKLLSEPLYLVKDVKKSQSASLVISSTYTSKEGTYSRLYPVSSVEVLSYKMSRVFFSRWHALRVLNDLHELDLEKPPTERTPQEGRKEDWLVDGYRSLAVRHHAAQARRSGTTFLARKVHRSEIKNIFGRHAVWLKQYVEKKHLLNLAFWDTFILESQRRLIGGGSEDEDKDELNRSGPSRERSRDPGEMAQPISNADEGASSKLALNDEGYVHTYTFMEAPPASPEKPLCTAVDLLDVPLEPFQTPILSAKLDWRCPFKFCHYHVDFLDQNDPVLNDLPANDRKLLFSKDWNSEDNSFTEIFYDIAERHYFLHLKTERIKVVGKRGDILAPGDISEGEEGIQLVTKSTRRRSRLCNVKAIGRTD